MNHRDRPVSSLFKGFAAASFLSAVAFCFWNVPQQPQKVAAKPIVTPPPVVQPTKNVEGAACRAADTPPAPAKTLEITKAEAATHGVALHNPDQSESSTKSDSTNRGGRRHASPLSDGSENPVKKPEPPAPKPQKIAQKNVTKAGNQGTEMIIPMSPAPPEPTPAAGQPAAQQPDLLMTPYTGGD